MSIDKKEPRYTTLDLIVKSMQNQKEQVEAIIMQQPDLINTKNAGLTPLHFVVIMQNYDILQLFLNHNGNPNILRESTNETCLDIAKKDVRFKNGTLLLIEYGALEANQIQELSGEIEIQPELDY